MSWWGRFGSFGRFMYPTQAHHSKALRLSAEDSAGLNLMRAALAATMSRATPVSMDEDHALPHKPQVPRVT